jgi:putative DNA primase/helicase
MLDSITTAPGGEVATARADREQVGTAGRRHLLPVTTGLCPDWSVVCSSSILFAAAAPLYWRAGLPAIPLIQGQKRPALNGWQAFCHRLPTELEQAAWLRQYPRGNIGLPLGATAGIDVVDIDTENPDFRRAIEGVLPRSPWSRVGQKGAALGFRHNGGRPFKIKGADGGMIVEVLSTGNQLVMPPSIHPATLAP